MGSLELIKLLAQYPAATVIVIAWPLLFVWLLQWVMKESAKREERLMQANDKWQAAVERLTEQFDQFRNLVTDRMGRGNKN